MQLKLFRPYLRFQFDCGYWRADPASCFPECWLGPLICHHNLACLHVLPYSNLCDRDDGSCQCNDSLEEIKNIEDSNEKTKESNTDEEENAYIESEEHKQQTDIYEGAFKGEETQRHTKTQWTLYIVHVAQFHTHLLRRTFYNQQKSNKWRSYTNYKQMGVHEM